jgi:hypothetical protein
MPTTIQWTVLVFDVLSKTKEKPFFGKFITERKLLSSKYYPKVYRLSIVVTLGKVAQ